MMLKAIKATVVSIVFFLGSLTPLVAQAPQKRLVKVTRIEGKRIYYSVYDYRAEQYLDASDLVLMEGLRTPGNPLGHMYYDPADIKLAFLEQGLARLRNPGVSSSTAVEAESKAKNQGIGIWSKPDIKEQRRGLGFNVDWRELLRAIWKPIAVVGSLGMLAPILYWLYKELYLKKRVLLLLAGDISAGKSALLERLYNPNVLRPVLEKLRPTEILRKYKGKHIPMGRHEIHPQFADTPGSKPALALNAILRYRLRDYIPSFTKVILIFVLSPTRKLENKMRDPQADVKYAYTQLGYLKVFCEAALLTRAARKPRLAILFINKFDLVSSYPPEDSASREILRAVEEEFSEHVNLFLLITKQGGVPGVVIVGSALEGWSCEMVKHSIERSLYGS